MSVSKKKGNNITVWCEYLQSYIFSFCPEENLGMVSRELDSLHDILSEKFGLSRKETAKYFAIYFKHELWTKYLEYVKAKQSYFGCGSSEQIK
jgi:hypothetical protein